MSKKKGKWFEFSFKRERQKKTDDQRITFVVPDRESLTAASKALAKVRIPVAPQLRMLENVYGIGDVLLRRLRKDRIEIIQKEGLSKEEAHKLNEQTFSRLIEQRNAIADIIGKMLHPVIKVVAAHTVELDDLYERLYSAEKRIRELEQVMKIVEGRAPNVPDLPGGKELWTGNVKAAAMKVVQNFEADYGASMPSFRSLHDASDQFFDAYEFRDKSRYTKEMFYASVKKANNPWGRKDTKGE